MFPLLIYIKTVKIHQDKLSGSILLLFEGAYWKKKKKFRVGVLIIYLFIYLFIYSFTYLLSKREERRQEHKLRTGADTAFHSGNFDILRTPKGLKILPWR